VSPRPQFMFDFVSPNAFLSHEAIPAIEQRASVKFEYVPILLGGIKAKLIENTQSAVERGAFGSPTFFVGNEMFFGKEQLREVEELVAGK
jgi:2-hydroxychromene-2-carboxylate isomerase